MDGLVPCSAEEAVQRMLELEASRLGEYVWGSGHYDPTKPELLGMTEVNGRLGWDCAGAAISQPYRLFRHRPGFNRTTFATVEDDINVDSIIEDADPLLRAGREELGEIVTAPAPGILLLTPTISLTHDHEGNLLPEPFHEPGHVRMILSVARWNPAKPRWADLVLLECKGPSGRKPGVVRTTGENVDTHDAKWPKPLHRAVMVRIRARAA